MTWEREAEASVESGGFPKSLGPIRPSGRGPQAVHVFGGATHQDACLEAILPGGRGQRGTADARCDELFWESEGSKGVESQGLRASRALEPHMSSWAPQTLYVAVTHRCMCWHAWHALGFVKAWEDHGATFLGNIWLVLGRFCGTTWNYCRCCYIIIMLQYMMTMVVWCWRLDQGSHCMPEAPICFVFALLVWNESGRPCGRAFALPFALLRKKQLTVREFLDLRANSAFLEGAAQVAWHR